MNKVILRGTDIAVNPIGLGTNAVGGQRLYPTIKDEAGRELLRTALENGIDFWDTAFIYGPKRSEEIIGEILQETGGRQRVVLATKAAHRFVDNKTVVDNSPAFLKQAVDDALTRLQTDYIDLFYIHFPDEATPKYESVGALKELKDAGKVRAIGVSNFSKEQLEEANQDGYVNVFQGEYNLIQRQAEKELFPYTIQHNISFVPFFPFASGLLAGKYDESTTFAKGDLRNDKPHFKGEAFRDSLQKVAELNGMAKDKNIEVAQLVLAWYLKQKAIDVIIPGAKKGEQAIKNLHAQNVQLSTGEIMKIDQLFS
ncbi:aldo/keto reductase [Virgibacillus sp. W0430]|uniref:aldo/keto reductase n=1 Tax=Virgibacillus sp. W0430 TaxID=3391580 RepID=UPI003F4559AD